MVGSGNCILCDATHFDATPYDAVWCSPPCQKRSSARTSGEPTSQYATDYLEWCLAIKTNILWVENILSQSSKDNAWGRSYNAAQFLREPIQNRNRVVGGRYLSPDLFRVYKKFYKELKLCPAVMATEYKGCASDKRRASRYYGRKLTIDECAYQQGFAIPEGWRITPNGYSNYEWKKNLYIAIGNGVPVYMARAFGEMYK